MEISRYRYLWFRHKILWIATDFLLWTQKKLYGHPKKFVADNLKYLWREISIDFLWLKICGFWTWGETDRSLNHDQMYIPVLLGKIRFGKFTTYLGNNYSSRY